MEYKRNRQGPKVQKLFQQKAGSLSPEERRAAHLAPAIKKLPPPPKWLKGSEGITQWEKEGNALIAAGVLSEPLIPVLVMRCLLWQEFTEQWDQGKPVPSGRMAWHRQLGSDLRILEMSYGFPRTTEAAVTSSGPIEKAPSGRPRKKQGRTRREEQITAPTAVPTGGNSGFAGFGTRNS